MSPISTTFFIILRSVATPLFRGEEFAVLELVPGFGRCPDDGIAPVINSWHWRLEYCHQRTYGELAMAEIQRDITRGVLAVLFILVLIGSSIWILRPFLGAIVWATTIVVATWPLMIAAQASLWGRRALAVTLMTFLLSCVLVVPLTFAIGTIVVERRRHCRMGKITGIVQAAFCAPVDSRPASGRCESGSVVGKLRCRGHPGSCHQSRPLRRGLCRLVCRTDGRCRRVVSGIFINRDSRRRHVRQRRGGDRAPGTLRPPSGGSGR